MTHRARRRPGIARADLGLVIWMAVCLGGWSMIVYYLATGLRLN